MSGAPSACPDPGVLDRFARGELAPAARADTEAHLDGCGECMRVVCELAAGWSALARATPPSSGSVGHVVTLDARGAADAPVELEVGAPIGRYRIHRRIGHGGMGVVYAAYDPELDRQVAIKLLHRDRGAELEAQRLRLVREAQAMAKLSHPNVVVVHDVGTHGDRLFIAMELVDGVTLTLWLRERERTRAEILRAFIHAGRGLAAAHAVGLVHRDFKPDNVLVGADQRVRVTDFGLARPQTGKADAIGSPGAFLGSSSERALTMDLTARGSLVGTPAYMAPEQFLGLTADARADQFSYCVALYEALFAARPFGGRTLQDLTLSVTEGRLTEPSAALAAPKWLRNALLRGLALQPQARHRDMDALLGELDKDRAWRNRFIASAGIGGGAAALVGAAYLAVVAGLGADPTPLPAPESFVTEATGCTRGEHKLESAWNDARRTELARGFAASGHADGAAKWEAIDATIAKWTDAWSTMHLEACEATTVRHEQSAELMDMRMHCLDRAAQALDASLRTLEQPDANTVARAESVAAALPRVEHCADLERVRAMATPVDHRDAVARLAGELATIEALTRLGKYREALSVAEALIARAQAEDAQRVLAEAQFRAASLRSKLDDPRGAEKGYVAAVVAARASGHDEVAMWGAINLVYNIGYEQRRPDDARLWVEAAESAVAKSANVEAEATLADYIGSVEFAKGDYEAALVQYERGIALEEKLSGPDHPDVASKLHNLGGTLARLGRHEEALALRQRSLAIMLKHRGPDHPQVADHTRGVGAELLALDRFEEAREMFARALEIRRAAYGEQHSAVGTSLDDMGVVLDELERDDEAVRSFEQALAIREKVLPPDHPDIAATMVRLAKVHEQHGRRSEAAALYERALAIRTRALGADDPLTTSAKEALERTR
ncbi:MAG TPA: serine/threonine-protein kinase [Nannocystaceae bacterium]|nr:serine/threonine-protein kinase [Nannocystaceae bacterium]